MGFSEKSLDLFLDNDEPYLLFSNNQAEEEEMKQSIDSSRQRNLSQQVEKPPLANKKIKGIVLFNKRIEKIKMLIQQKAEEWDDFGQILS